MNDSLMKQLKDLRRRFDVLHADGLDALRNGDYERLSLAIRKEGLIIEQQGRLLESFMVQTERRPRRKPKRLNEA